MGVVAAVLGFAGSNQDALKAVIAGPSSAVRPTCLRAWA